MEVILSGTFGGLSNEILHWYGLRTNSVFPQYLKSPFYWIITFLMILVGAGFAYLQLGPGHDDLFLAFQLGLLAPLLLKKIVTIGKPSQGAMSEKRPTLREFLKG